ncbi:MAG: hypothetical protein WC650_05290 [Candidatus Doudnabacteria bacterium]
MIIVSQTTNAEDSITLAQKGFGVGSSYRTIQMVGEKSFYEERILILPNFKNGNELSLEDSYTFLIDNREIKILSIDQGDSWWSKEIYTEETFRESFTSFVIKINGIWNPTLNPIKNPKWCEGTILFRIYYVPLIQSPTVKYETTLIPGITFTGHWDAKNLTKPLPPINRTKIATVWGSLRQK